jgi:hypothetical protein
MAIQARVTSTDALELFRASLIVFLSKAHRCVDDVGDEVRRTRVWLQHDQTVHWAGELRRRTKLLEQAQQDLLSAKMASHNEAAMMVRQAAVTKARNALNEVENKIRTVKKWIQGFDSSVDPSVKKLESLRQFLANDMPKAIAYLVNVQRTLDLYASAQAPTSESAPAATAPAEPENPS